MSTTFEIRIKMAPRNNNSVENTCNKCLKEVKNVISCFKCNKTYHPVLKICGIYVNDDGEIVCCENITSKQYKCDEEDQEMQALKMQCELKDLEIQNLKCRLSELNEVVFEQSIGQQLPSMENGDLEHNISVSEQNTESEVNYSNMIIKEKSNLITELHDKINILKKHISLLEK